MADSIFPLTAADAAQLRDISRETFADTFGPFNTAEDMTTYLNTAYSINALTAELENPNTAFYFLKHDDEVVGYMKLNVEDAQSESEGDGALEVERVYIRPAFKRMGFGHEMMDFAISRGYQLDKSFVWLSVWSVNHAARKFYESLGFVNFGVDLFRLGNARLHSEMMRKEL